ncbi:flavoprotein [Goodfellowiella coeruleoviolacea]|uniref:Flavoprotein n=1 Tax=Goodfellowiella coeruleoviolacea TaxID=334858 RepID=A0AAE3GLH9_9PSEU|nr:flavoprotein [Goodfellowiella coeruleoviolacea]MCP2170215.1 Flavoprotein [Goodfellowiella coeruleoviolacea]
MPGVLGVVASGAGGVEQRLRVELVAPAVRRGWRVAVTLTPTAARWLADNGELDRLAELSDLPVRSTSRLPNQPKPHPVPDCFLFAPATANSVAKLALGIADNQALTVLCEALGTPGLPVVLHPQVNQAHAAHPAYPGHLAVLAAAGVRIVSGESAQPWQRLLDVVDEVTGRAHRGV